MHRAGPKRRPTLTAKKTYDSLDNWFLHMCVIKKGIENIWGIWECSKKYLLNSPTTVSIAAGGGVPIDISCVCNSNQSYSSNVFKFSPPHNVTVLYLNQEVIQLTTRPPYRSLAVSFSGIKSNRFHPFIITPERYPWDNPSMPACFIRVTSTRITWRMQPVFIYNNRSLSTNVFRLYEFEWPL